MQNKNQQHANSLSMSNKSLNRPETIAATICKDRKI